MSNAGLYVDDFFLNMKLFIPIENESLKNNCLDRGFMYLVNFVRLGNHLEEKMYESL